MLSVELRDPIKLIITVTLFISCIFSPLSENRENLIFFGLFILLFLTGNKNNFTHGFMAILGAGIFNPVLNFAFYHYSIYNILLKITLIAILNLNIFNNLFQPKNSKEKNSKIPKELIYNKEKGVYEIKDGVYRYELDQELINSFSDYYNKHEKLLIIDTWVKQLNSNDRKKVKKYFNPYRRDTY